MTGETKLVKRNDKVLETNVTEPNDIVLLILSCKEWYTERKVCSECNKVLCWCNPAFCWKEAKKRYENAAQICSDA